MNQNTIPEASYYVAVFGDPDGLPRKDRVEEGRYIPDSNHWPSGIMEGDILLLYCTGSYVIHSMETPGIGIVLRIDEHANAIFYRYLQLGNPISMEYIQNHFEAADREKFDLRRFSTFWIFEVTKNSFKSAMSKTTIVW